MLSDHERDQLKARHKQERDGRERDRIKAVLLHDKGWSPQQIAEALFIPLFAYLLSLTGKITGIAFNVT